MNDERRDFASVHRSSFIVHRFREGAMAERYIYNKKTVNAPIRRRLDHRFIRWVMSAAVVGSLVAFSYVYSARCRFEAIALGYETQQKREELERRIEERRKLELERERELAPEQLERRARRLGLNTPQHSSATEPKPQAEPRTRQTAR
jgi:hypothetical protein